MEYDPEEEQPQSEPDIEGENIFDGDDDDEENLMDDAEGDVASSDSELQVEDPSHEKGSTTGMK
jgi:hypothetical protein